MNMSGDAAENVGSYDTVNHPPQHQGREGESSTILRPSVCMPEGNFKTRLIHGRNWFLLLGKRAKPTAPTEKGA